LYTSSAQENFVWLVFIGVHRRSSAANMGFWFSRRTGEKAHRAAEVLPSGGSGGVAIISTFMLRTRSCRREPYRFNACIINMLGFVCPKTNPEIRRTRVHKKAQFRPIPHNPRCTADGFGISIPSAARR
jgi:hypothetical protein